MIKAKLQLKYGSLSTAAAKLGCSVSGLAAAANGKCPGILRKIEAATSDVEVLVR